MELDVDIAADGDSLIIQLPTGLVEIFDSKEIVALRDSNIDDVRTFSKITEAFKFAGGT